MHDIVLQRNRERMVRELREAGNITNPAVLEALRTVPRHLFVQEALAYRAYDDCPLPIGYGQTISQPSTVAGMTQALDVRPSLRILEIGTGSGYQAAVLHSIGCIVFTVERVRELYETTQRLFAELNMRGIRQKFSDGTLGWAETGPYDRIIVTAGGPDVPQPLLEQLLDPGIMLIPVGEQRRTQKLVRVTKKDGAVSTETLDDASFVDLIGAHGWSEQRRLST